MLGMQREGLTTYAGGGVINFGCDLRELTALASPLPNKIRASEGKLRDSQRCEERAQIFQRDSNSPLLASIERDQQSRPPHNRVPRTLGPALPFNLPEPLVIPPGLESEEQGKKTPPWPGTSFALHRFTHEEGLLTHNPAVAFSYLGFRPKSVVIVREYQFQRRSRQRKPEGRGGSRPRQIL